MSGSYFADLNRSLTQHSHSRSHTHNSPTTVAVSNELRAISSVCVCAKFTHVASSRCDHTKNGLGTELGRSLRRKFIWKIIAHASFCAVRFGVHTIDRRRRRRDGPTVGIATGRVLHACHLNANTHTHTWTNAAKSQSARVCVCFVYIATAHFSHANACAANTPSPFSAHGYYSPDRMYECANCRVIYHITEFRQMFPRHYSSAKWAIDFGDLFCKCNASQTSRNRELPTRTMRIPSLYRRNRSTRRGHR